MQRIPFRGMLAMAVLLIFTGCGLTLVHEDRYRGHDWDDYGGYYMQDYDGGYGAHRIYHHGDDYDGHRMDHDDDYDGHR